METGQKELRQELLGLGFPEEVLADLTDQEVALLDGADAVMVKSDLSRWDTRHEIDHISTYFIQVELPDDMVRYFVWFSWDEGPSSRLRESLEIIPDWTHEAILPPSALQGRLLWDEAGQLYQSLLLGKYGPIRPKAASSSEPAATSPSASTSPCPGVGNTSVAMSPMRPGCRSRN